jgi:hypothetical protein
MYSIIHVLYYSSILLFMYSIIHVFMYSQPQPFDRLTFDKLSAGRAAP